MTAPALVSAATAALDDNSLPLTRLPICSSRLASALMPEPPMPTRWTRCAWLRLSSDTPRASRATGQRSPARRRRLRGQMPPPLGNGQACSGDWLALIGRGHWRSRVIVVVVVVVVDLAIIVR